MTKDVLIKKTLKTLSRLPQDKVKEISDFAEFILKKYDKDILQKGIERLVIESKTYGFLQDEESLYSVNDLKEKY
jgi:hypothetical protein